MAKRTSGGIRAGGAFERAADARTDEEEKAYFEVVGKNIREARLKAGISQEKLAEILGVTFQQIQKYEKGINRISVRRLALVSEALEKPFNTFLSKEHQLPKAINDLSEVWPKLSVKERKNLEGLIESLKEKYGSDSKPRGMKAEL